MHVDNKAKLSKIFQSKNSLTIMCLIKSMLYVYALHMRISFAVTSKTLATYSEIRLK